MTNRQKLELFAVVLAIILFSIGILRSKGENLLARAMGLVSKTENETDVVGETSASDAMIDETQPEAEVGQPSAAPSAAPASSLQHIPADGDASGLPFSAAVVAGSTIHISGTLGLETETRTPPDDPSEEARLAMESFKKSVEAAGATMGDLVSVRVFCSDAKLYEAFNAVYRTYFADGKYPARAFIITQPLLFGARFEVAGIAVRTD